jgi:hypothetical protein
MEDQTMSVVVRFSPTSLTAAKYDESVKRSEVWDSREQLQAFGERLMPLLSDVGIEFSSEPEIFEVHNTFSR